MFTRLWRSGPALLILGTFFWSSNFIVGRAFRDEIAPVALSFWRWSLALVILLLVASRQIRLDAPILLRSWKRVLALGFLGIAVFNTLVYLGLHTTSVVNGVLMQSAMPLLIILGSFLLLKERVHWFRLVAVVVSLVGVAVIVAHGSLRILLSLQVNSGDLLIFAAVVCYALYSVLLRGRPRVHPVSFLAALVAVGVCLLLPAYIAELAILGPFPGTQAVYLAIVYVAVFPSILSFLFFNRAVELIGANHAGHYLHLMPVYGSLLAAVFLDERLQFYHFIGAALIAAGILLAALAPRRPNVRLDNLAVP